MRPKLADKGWSAWYSARLGADFAGASASIAAALAAYRVRTRSALSYEGLALITATGPLPVGLIRQLIRGLPILAVAGVLLVWVI